MKKLIRNNFKLIIGLILGILIFGVTVSAKTILYNSNQVSFEAEDTDNTATDVKEALDALYNFHKYLGNMSSAKCVSGIYEKQANLDINIQIGFEPKLVFLSFEHSTNYHFYTFYNGYVKEDVYTLVNNNGSLSGSSSNVSIGSNIVSNYNKTGGVYTKEFNVYYVACK